MGSQGPPTGQAWPVPSRRPCPLLPLAAAHRKARPLSADRANALRSVHPRVGGSTWVTQGGCCGAGRVGHPLRLSAGPGPLSSASWKWVQGPGFPGPAGQARGGLGQRGRGSDPCRAAPPAFLIPPALTLLGAGQWGFLGAQGPGPRQQGPHTALRSRDPWHTGSLAAPWPVLPLRRGV